MAYDRGKWEGKAKSKKILDADAYRDGFIIQLANRVQASVGFGEKAKLGEGIQLLNIGDAVIAKGYAATLEIQIIGEGAEGTYQTGNITYAPGSQPVI